MVAAFLSKELVYIASLLHVKFATMLGLAGYLG
jgi:hypothetical protein